MHDSPSPRPATLEDLVTAASWIRTPQECEMWAGWRVHFPIDLDTLPAAIEFSTHDAYAWTIADRLVAFGQIVTRSSGRRHLARIIVDPASRRQGHGEAFVRALLARVCGNLVSLNVSAHNASAVSLYRRLGFVDAVRPEDESGSPESSYMELDSRAG